MHIFTVHNVYVYSTACIDDTFKPRSSRHEDFFLSVLSFILVFNGLICTFWQAIIYHVKMQDTHHERQHLDFVISGFSNLHIVTSSNPTTATTWAQAMATIAVRKCSVEWLKHIDVRHRNKISENYHTIKIYDLEKKQLREVVCAPGSSRPPCEAPLARLPCAAISEQNRSV